MASDEAPEARGDEKGLEDDGAGGRAERLVEERKKRDERGRAV